MEKRILIVGAGAAGRALADDVRNRGGQVLGFLDDSVVAPEILGTLDSVNAVTERFEIELVYFAIPSAPAQRIRDFVNTLDLSNINFAIIPRTYEILSKDTVNIDDLSDVDVLDLLGRSPVKHDLVGSAEFVAGKCVVVTGAAGSIGSQVVRQLMRLGARRIVCVDWWENGLFHLEGSLKANTSVEFHVGDVKNEAMLDGLFAAVRPDAVFHAAAYKHVPMMQSNPLEAINNNVWGTLNVFQLAIKHAVTHVVYVSTDKAVNPVNVMGATKRIGEMVMESLAGTTTTTVFNGVRFGNVIQSNGSVMETFRAQISRGEPLTVTHPDITRFFMTVDEASNLIIQSAFVGEPGDIFVLDMGDAVRISELAENLIQATNPELTVNYIGLRPGEKMFEELSYEPSKVGVTSNPKIFVTSDAREFESDGFLARVEGLISQARTYSLSNAQAIDALRSFGFAIK